MKYLYKNITVGNSFTLTRVILNAICFPSLKVEFPKLFSCILDLVVPCIFANFIDIKRNFFFSAFKSYEIFQAKLQLCKIGGKRKLQIVSDFDFTLSKFNVANNQRGFSSHAVIENCDILNEIYHQKAKELQMYYYVMISFVYFVFIS